MVDRGAPDRMSADLLSLRARLVKLAGAEAFSFQKLLPLMKVDGERREVEGVATSEPVDSQGEILSYAGSKNAFKSWAGNLREMHSNLAAGRAVAVMPDDNLKRITVRARISKGAESTWQKMLGATLRFFSVGGTRVRSEVGADGIRRATAWRIGELSLVDIRSNPETAMSLVASSTNTLRRVVPPRTSACSTFAS